MNNNTGIAIFVYNRPEHAKTVFDNLLRNPEFKDIPTVIFGDGKRNKGDENWDKMKLVAEEFASENSNVKLQYRKKNIGVRNSIILGVTEMFNKFDSLIVIEDDISTSPAFLKFMLDGLSFYEKNERVACISGYNHPAQLMEIPTKYSDEVYFTLRTCSWGWATWKDCWIGIDWDLKDFKSLSKDSKRIKEFNSWGEDLFGMLKDQIYGKINAWDIAWTYHCFKNERFTVYPIKSFVENIGHDGTGEHSKSANREIFVNNDLNLSREVKFVKDPYVDNGVIESFRKVYRRDFKYYIRKSFAKLKEVLFK